MNLKYLVSYHRNLLLSSSRSRSRTSQRNSNPFKTKLCFERRNYWEKLPHLPNIEEKCSQSKEEGEGSYGAWSGWHHDGMVWGCFHDGLWLMIMDLKSSEQLKWLRCRKILNSLWIIVNQAIMILILTFTQEHIMIYQYWYVDFDIDSLPRSIYW